LETAVKRLYEAMFLVDSAQASDWDAVESTIKTILKKAKAEIVSIGNWSERKLAYEINSKSRGTYILCYFRADGEKITNIEKAVRLSEQIMRVLILSAENREKEALEGVTATLPEPAHHEAGDKPAVSKTEDETKSPPEEGETVIQEDTLAAPAEEEQGEPDQETEEEVSTEQETAEADEPEKPAEPEASDVSEPEQPETEETEKDTSV
jgi:small subunit ribosomal protein S6